MSRGRFLITVQDIDTNESQQLMFNLKVDPPEKLLQQLSWAFQVLVESKEAKQETTKD